MLQKIDRRLGVPVCALLTLIDSLRDFARAPTRLGDAAPPDTFHRPLQTRWGEILRGLQDQRPRPHRTGMNLIAVFLNHGDRQPCGRRRETFPRFFGGAYSNDHP
jgi:hypothetical protein